MKFAATLCTVLLTLRAFAQEADPKVWTVRDVIWQENVTDAVFSPDGKSVVWVKSRPSEKKDRFVTNLWMTRPGDAKPREMQLTRGEESDRTPMFSADGQTLYFLSSRAGGKSLWAMPMTGGEPYVLDSFPDGISAVRKINDSLIYYVAEEGEWLYEAEMEKKKDDVEVVEDTVHYKPSRVFAYNLNDKSATRLTPSNRYPIGEYAGSADGKWLITSDIRSPHYGVDGLPKPVLLLWNLSDGSVREVIKGMQQVSGFEFTRDNSGFYFTAVQSSDPQWDGSGINLLYFFDLKEMRAVQVDLQHPWGLGAGFEVAGNDVFALLANGATDQLAVFQKNGLSWSKKGVQAGKYDEHLSVLETSDDQKQVLIVYSTASLPPQFRVCQYNAADASLDPGQMFATLNKHLEKKPKARAEVVYWKGSLGDRVDGILYYPHNYQPGRSYPLMTAIHGGPSATDKDEWQDSWAYYPNLMAQKGCFYLMPNYHGSSNHGQAFVESIKGHYYEYEVPDIMKGIDSLVAKGLINRDSLAVMGWSNGAILTTSLIIQYPGLFKAAAPGAGDVNWTSDFGTCEFGVTFDQSYFKGAPWDDTKKKPYNEAYILKSPLFDMEKIVTPTLLSHGSEDRAVPRDQSHEYYRALQQIGKAPVRFLWYPDQPHSLRKISYQTRKVEEEMRWWETYFFGTYKPENEAVKKESPLTALLEKEKSATHNGLYGYLQNKVLLPEVVVLKADSIAIGRFEVTNAQWQQFRSGYSYLASEANHPVSGISADDARDYTVWLSDQTGGRYRLPNAAEAEALQEKALDIAASENTLPYWAGYEITRDDAQRLRAKLTEVKTTLTLEVGTFTSTSLGKASIYDLGGNVSEYFEQNGKSGLYGYSAWDLPDAEEKQATRAPKGAGLRVVQQLK